MINGIRVGRIRMFPLLQIQFTTQSVPYDPVSVRSMRRKSNQSQGLESSIVIGLFLLPTPTMLFLPDQQLSYKLNLRSASNLMSV